MATVAECRRFVGDRESLKQLIELLASDGYEVIGPTVRDGAIVYDRLASVEDLPAGWRDVQEAGRYRLERRDDEALFGYVVGPQSFKKFLHPADIRLFQAKREDGGFRIIEHREPAKRYAFVGVRACEVAAIRIQDRVLLEDHYTDRIYQGRRSSSWR